MGGGPRARPQSGDLHEAHHRLRPRRRVRRRPPVVAAPASADEFTPAQKQELGAFIKDYLVNNPDVLREAIEALDKHDKGAAEAERQKVVASAVERAVQLEISGDHRQPEGRRRRWSSSSTTIATICKGALPDVTKLMKDDPNLKLVLKDYPVLGPGSVEAAKVAIAARNQLPGDKFWAFHIEAACRPTGRSARRRRWRSPASSASTWTSSPRTWRAPTSRRA